MFRFRTLQSLIGAGALLAAGLSVSPLAHAQPIPQVNIPGVNAQVVVRDKTGRVCVTGFGQSGQSTNALVVQDCNMNIAGGGQVGNDNNVLGVQSGSVLNKFDVIQVTPPR